MTSRLSFEVNPPQKVIDQICAQNDNQRSQIIIDIIVKYFGDGIRNNPTVFRGRFRKMAATPFYFYRRSALLFYQDLKVDKDPWVSFHPPAGNIFIHGDLHAENFRSYLDSHGILNFDVNDFDEGYCGPFTWNVKCPLASLNLVAHSKGFSDREIEQILCVCESFKH